MAAASTPRSIQASLYIDGRPAENSIKNVRQAASTLRREIERMVIGSNEYNNAIEQLRAHERTLQNHRDEINGVSGAFGFLSTEMGRLAGLAAGFFSFDFITDQFQDIIASNAELSDSLADVRKTTGLSEEAVRRLQGELNKLQTRSSSSELLGLAEVAGKLGVVGERDVLGFVRAADKIKVALGGDLGDAESAINSLGKLTELFKIKQEFGLEQALIKTGSAINSLGAAGTASEAYIVEFTKRMGGIAPQANFSIQSIMGLAATMDELGQPVEASSTAIGQFIVGLGKDVPGFAKIAGMSVKDFSAVLKKDGNQALLEVLKNLQSTGTGVAGLAEKMGLIGEEGAKATSTLGALSNNLDLLVTRQAQSNDEFGKGSSLQQEFDVKMSTLAAVIDRVSNKFNLLSTNTVLTDFLKYLVLAFSNLLDWGEKNAVMLVNLTKFLIVGVAAWGGYRLAIILTNTALEINAARIALARTATIAFAGVQALLSGNLARAAAAMRLLNITASANPFGAILAVVTALIAAVALFGRTTSAAQKTQESFNTIEGEAKKNQMAEIDRIRNLTKIIDDENISRSKKLIAVKQLRDIMPDALKHLTDEGVLTDKNRIAVDKFIQALERKSIAEAAQAQITKLRQRNIEIDSGATNDTSLWQDTKSFVRAGTITEMRANQKQYGRENAKEEKVDNVAQIKQITERYKKEMFNVDDILKVGDVTKGGQSTGGLSEKDKGTGTEAAKKKAIAEFEKLDDQYKKLNLQRLDDQLSANEKEVAQEKNKYDALIKQEEEFLKFKGITADQKRITEEAITTLESDKQTAVTNLRLRQETDMLQKVAELRTALADVHESELTKEQDRINKFYDEQERKNAGNEKALAMLRRDRIKELNQSEIREKERLEKEKAAIEDKYDTLSGNKREKKVADINKKYDDEITALKESFKGKIQATKEFQDAIAAIEKNRAVELKNQSQIEIQEKKEFAIGVAQEASDATFSIITSNQKAESDQRISAIQRDREAELSNKNLTEQQKDAINKKYDQKVKQEKLKAWKANQTADIVQAGVNGALAVTKALAQTGVLAGFVIPGIIATTALQIGVIAGQPTPQFAGGGFSDEDPAGYVSKSTIFNRSASGRPFEAGERGTEWIAPNWMVKSPRFANVINTLEAVRKQGRSYASGGFNGEPTSSVAAPSSGYDFARLENMMQEMVIAQRSANDKKVYQVYSDLELMRDTIEQTRVSQSA